MDDLIRPSQVGKITLNSISSETIAKEISKTTNDIHLRTRLPKGVAIKNYWPELVNIQLRKEVENLFKDAGWKRMLVHNGFIYLFWG